MLDSVIYYIIGIIVTLIVVLNNLLGRKQTKNWTFIDYIPLLYIVIWAYGVILGFIKDNNKEYIIANFAGMVLYCSYYLLLYSNVSLKIIYKYIIFLSLFNIILSIIFYYYFFIFFLDYELIANSFFLKNYKPLGSSTGQYRLYWSGLCIIYALYSICIVKLFKKGTYKLNLFQKLINFLGIIASTVGLFFIPASKGFLLGLIILTILIVFTQFIYFKRTNIIDKTYQFNLHINKNFILIILFAVSFVAAINTLKFDNIFDAITSKEDVSNTIRYEQLGLLLDETTFWGNGLGACLQSGYNRATLEVTSCYGFELNYVNLFHKFGVFAMGLMFMYFYTLFYCVKLLIDSSVQVEYRVIPISLMMFTIPAIGNPILFSATSAMLHCITLYYLKKLKLKL